MPETNAHFTKCHNLIRPRHKAKRLNSEIIIGMTENAIVTLKTIVKNGLVRGCATAVDDLILICFFKNLI
jgi:hypothetical protein